MKQRPRNAASRWASWRADSRRSTKQRRWTCSRDPWLAAYTACKDW